MRSHVRALLALTMAFGLISPPLAGQTYWTELSTTGYGAVGVGAALAACWDCSYEAAGAVLLATGAAGSLLGYYLGGSAESAGRGGEHLSTGQLLGARVGTVTGIAALGAALAALYINNTDGSAEGEDERTLLMFSATGAVLGIVLEVVEERKLAGSALPDRVGLHAGRGPEGSASIGLSVALGGPARANRR